MSETLVTADPETKQSIAVAAKTWHYFLRASTADAAQFANQNPPQGAGEALFSVRDDGRVDTFLYF
jgi:hypothetical protein